MSSEPYTHQAHALRFGEAARRREVLVQHVAARKGKIAYFAVIRAPWTTPDSKDCWTLEAVWPERTKNGTPRLHACAPYLEIEASAHKAFLGHKILFGASLQRHRIHPTDRSLAMNTVEIADHPPTQCTKSYGFVSVRLKP